MPDKFQGVIDKKLIPIQAGDTVTIPKGVIVRSTNPKVTGEIAARTTKVTVESIVPGTNYPVGHKKHDPQKPVTNPKIQWTSKSGNTFTVDINDLPEVFFSKRNSLQGWTDIILETPRVAPRKRAPMEAKKPSFDVTLKARKVVLVVSKDGTDRLNIQLDMPTPFPEMKYPGTFTLEVRKGYGTQWCRENLGIEPEILDVG
jgi:hypothetical protein